MASPVTLPRTAPTRSFLEVYDPEAREKISNDMLDRGADATVVDHGQNTLTLLLSHDRLADSDPALAQRLIDGGADVDFRNSGGDVPIRLAIRVRVDDDEQRRPLYEVLFAANVDLDEPSSVRNPKNEIGKWLRLNVDHQPERLKVLDEFLTARGF